MTELQRWTCRQGHTFDVWVDDDELPEDPRAVFCPVCWPRKELGHHDVEESDLWEPE